MAAFQAGRWPGFSVRREGRRERVAGPLRSEYVTGNYPSPSAACCCRLTIPRRRWRGSRGWSQRYAPRVVIALGDSFHDGGGPARIADADRAALAALQRGRDWIWIAGNHDPDPADGIGGRFADALALGPLTFRHEPSAQAGDGEIAGHLHPVARVAQRGRAVSRRCFAGDGRRLVMPAFGAYAGGLNVRDRAIAALFGTLAFTAHMLGEQPALRHRRRALPAGLSCVRCRIDGQSRRNTTLAIQPVSSAIMAVASP